MKALAVVLYLATSLAALPFRDPNVPWNPPAQYDHEYDGDWQIKHFSSLEKLQAYCSMQQAYACSLYGEGYCVTALPTVGTMMSDGHPLTVQGYKNIKRHERGHCNGWPPNHPET